MVENFLIRGCTMESGKIMSCAQLQEMEAVLARKLLSIGVECVIVIDMAGNTVISKGDGAQKYDVSSFAALAAGNFASVDAMAKLIGEEEFSLLFHKGHDSSIHFSRINEELLLVCLFGHDLSLGFLRLNVADSIRQIKGIWDREEADV